LLCSNHISYFDPPLVGSLLDRPCWYMAKQELFGNRILRYFLEAIHAFPVSRGRPDRTALRRGLRLLSEGKALVVFPEGTRKAEYRSTVQPGILFLIYRSRVPVVPVKVGDTDRFFEGNPFRIIYGKPVDFSEIIERETRADAYVKISAGLRNAMAAL
ncbi:MAG TPA: lysophospholipid acyltransferase family protein, partial [bacterium]|nr:lysophospholipid acyltransferase family protein [bacterium]